LKTEERKRERGTTEEELETPNKVRPSTKKGEEGE